MTDELQERLRAMNPEPLGEPSSDELAAVFAVIEARRSTMSVDEIRDTSVPTTAKHAGSRGGVWRRPVVAFAGMALLMVLVVSGAALLFNDSSGPVAGTTPADTTVTTVVSTTEAVVPTTVPFSVWALGADWEPVAIGGEVAKSAVAFVDGIGWIAVGGPFASISEDGLVWTPSDDAGLMTDDAAFLTGVTAGGPGALVWGHTCEGGGDLDWESLPCPQDPVVYGSSDGLVWERLDDDSFLGCSEVEEPECYASTQYVAVAPSGSLLAAGPDQTVAGPNGYTTTGAAWTSEDGSVWLRHELDLTDITPEGWTVAGFDGPLHSGDRWLAFVPMMRWPEDGDFAEGMTVVVESVDGADWQRIDGGGVLLSTTNYDDFLDGLPEDSAFGSAGVIVVAGKDVWWSTDGLEWTHSDLPDDAHFYRVLASDGGFLLSSGGRDAPGAHFAYSTDGVTWESVEASDLNLTHVQDVAKHNGTIVAVGHLDDAAQTPAIWRWSE